MGAAVAGVVYDPAAGAADSKRILLLAAAVIAVAMVIAQKRSALRARSRARGELRENGSAAPACVVWFGFVGWSALSLVWGVPSGLGTLGTWVGATGLLAAAMNMPREEARRAAGIAAAGIGGISAAAAIAQYGMGARGLAAHGGHGNPNWLGLVLAAALPMSIDLAADLRRAGSRLWWPTAAAAVIEVPGLWLSHSRVAWAACAAALVVWAVSARLFRGAPVILAGALAGALVLSGARATANPKESDNPAELAEPTDIPIATAWEGRVWIWTASADAARSALPFGEGLGGFPAAYLDAQGARLRELELKVASRRFLNATTAHCDWIEAAVAGGVPGILLLLGAVGAGIWGLAQCRWGAGAAALVAFGICAMGDSPMHQPGVMILVALSLGACPRGWKAPRRAFVNASSGLLLAATALLLAASTGAWLSVRRVTRADEALPADRISLLSSAVRLDPWSGEAALSLGLARLEVNDSRGALRDLRRSRGLLANVGTDVAIGNALVMGGDPERAAEAYKRALSMHPGYFRARANLAEVHLLVSRFDDAEAELAAARSLWPGHPRLLAITERLRRARLEQDTGAQEEP